MTHRSSDSSPVTSAPHRFIGSLFYGLYTWTTFLVLGLTALAGMGLPGLERRRRVARRMSRTLLTFVGMPLVVRNLERIPEGQCVVVANHASYLDGVVMTAALPPRFGFVIKREMEAVPVAGTLLRRLGSEFVERFIQADAEHALFFIPSARDGHSMFDLAGFIRMRLENAGVLVIDDTGVDTYSDERFFSYRRSVHRKEPDYGRHVHAIVLERD